MHKSQLDVSSTFFQAPCVCVCGTHGGTHATLGQIYKHKLYYNIYILVYIVIALANWCVVINKNTRAVCTVALYTGE